MPRKGYETLTVQSWLIDCITDAAAPGEGIQSVIRRMLLKDLGKARMQKRYDEWRDKYGK